MAHTSGSRRIPGSATPRTPDLLSSNDPWTACTGRPSLLPPSGRHRQAQNPATRSGRGTAFLDAWERLRWLQPRARARILDALWWKLRADATTEALLTLIVCDGWTFAELTAVTWRDVDLREGTIVVAGKSRRLLPHTAGLLARLDAGNRGSLWGDLDPEAILEKLRAGWEALTRLALPKGGKSSLFPSWDQVRSRIEPG